MILVGALPILVSKESASECAGSVDITNVRSPALAARTAVAAATVVLPTPPLPVNRMTRIEPAYLAPLRRQRVARMARTAMTLMVACATMEATNVRRCSKTAARITPIVASPKNRIGSTCTNAKNEPDRSAAHTNRIRPRSPWNRNPRK